MPSSAIIISIALVLYSTATWWEKINGRLIFVHLVLFWSGLVFDTVGTGIMIHNSTAIGFNLHTFTGYIGIILMFVHTAWASIVLKRKNQPAIMNFHKFSLVVWTLWMFSYVNGAFLGISNS